MALSRARGLRLLQHEIASAALSGVGAEEIERSVIAPSDCSEDDKPALRLYAFSFLPRFDQRRLAIDRLYGRIGRTAKPARELRGGDGPAEARHTAPFSMAGAWSRRADQ